MQPARPDKRSCSAVADDLTAVVVLDVSATGKVCVSELSVLGLAGLEGEGEPRPEAFVGAVKRVHRDGSTTTMEANRNRDQILLPGDVAVGRYGNVYVTTPSISAAGPGRVALVREQRPG